MWDLIVLVSDHCLSFFSLCFVVHVIWNTIFFSSCDYKSIKTIGSE